MTRADRTNARHWVYRCFDADGRLIYVGSTTDLFGRLASHRATSWWSPTVAKVTSKVYPNGVEARAIERAIIADEIPRWNKVGKWGSRSRWTEADWIDWITLVIRGSNSGRPLNFATNELRRAVADFTALHDKQLPAHLMVTVATLEAADEQRKIRNREEQILRQAEVRRLDELALARDKKARKKGRAS